MSQIPCYPGSGKPTYLVNSYSYSTNDVLGLKLATTTKESKLHCGAGTLVVDGTLDGAGGGRRREEVRRSNCGSG